MGGNLVTVVTTQSIIITVGVSAPSASSFGISGHARREPRTVDAPGYASAPHTRAQYGGVAHHIRGEFGCGVSLRPALAVSTDLREQDGRSKRYLKLKSVMLPNGW